MRQRDPRNVRDALLEAGHPPEEVEAMLAAAEVLEGRRGAAAEEGGKNVSCMHEDVVPILPVDFIGWRTEVDGVCARCGEAGFVVWEAYGYGDASAERQFPTDAEVLEDFEAFWRSQAQESPAPE